MWSKALLLAVIVVAGCGKVSTNAPEKANDAKPLPTAVSLAVVPISPDVAALQTQLNAAIPERVFTIDEGRDACVPAKWAIVRVGGVEIGRTKIIPDIDCHIDGHVDRGL